jgi:hypothetical protein
VWVSGVCHGEMPFLFFVDGILIAKHPTCVNERYVFCSLLIVGMQKRMALVGQLCAGSVRLEDHGDLAIVRAHYESRCRKVE